MEQPWEPLEQRNEKPTNQLARTLDLNAPYLFVIYYISMPGTLRPRSLVIFGFHAFSLVFWSGNLGVAELMGNCSPTLTHVSIPYSFQTIAAFEKVEPVCASLLKLTCGLSPLHHTGDHSREYCKCDSLLFPPVR